MPEFSPKKWGNTFWGVAVAAVLVNGAYNSGEARSEGESFASAWGGGLTIDNLYDLGGGLKGLQKGLGTLIDWVDGSADGEPTESGLGQYDDSRTKKMGSAMVVFVD